MARILNVCPVSMAWNAFRNALRPLICGANPSGWLPCEDTVALAFHEASIDLVETVADAAVEDIHTLTVDAVSDAFESAGFSRELGASMYRYARLQGTPVLPSQRLHNLWIDLMATPEMTRAIDTERSAGSTPAE